MSISSGLISTSRAFATLITASSVASYALSGTLCISRDFSWCISLNCLGGCKVHSFISFSRFTAFVLTSSSSFCNLVFSFFTFSSSDLIDASSDFCDFKLLQSVQQMSYACVGYQQRLSVSQPTCS